SAGNTTHIPTHTQTHTHTHTHTHMRTHTYSGGLKWDPRVKLSVDRHQPSSWTTVRHVNQQALSLTHTHTHTHTHTKGGTTGMNCNTHTHTHTQQPNSTRPNA